jgi:hypothetical protein
MTSEEAAWVAGIIEGEGCLDFNDKAKRCPRVRIEMTDSDVLRRVQAVAGGRITEPKRRQSHWKPIYLLTINGRDTLGPILRMIRPWLGERRGQKADELIAACTCHEDVL